MGNRCRMPDSVLSMMASSEYSTNATICWAASDACLYLATSRAAAHTPSTFPPVSR